MTLLAQGTDAKRAKAIPFPRPGAEQRIYEGFVKDSAGGDIPFYCNIIAAATAQVPGMNLTDLMKAPWRRCLAMHPRLRKSRSRAPMARRTSGR